MLQVITVALLLHFPTPERKNIILYAGLIFFSSVSFYSFHRWFGIYKLADKIKLYPRWEKLSTYRRAYWILFILGGVFSGVCFLLLPFEWWSIALIPALFSALYALPLFRGKRARDFGDFKIIWLCLGWVWLCTLVPCIVLDTNTTITSLISIERLCLMISLTLPFDYRDIKLDQESQVITWPQQLGRKKSQILTITLAMISIAINAILIFEYELENMILIGQLIASLLLLLASFKAYAKQTPNDWFFSFWLDGILILPFLIWYVLNTLFT